MTPRRKNLLVGIPLLLGFLFIGRIGPLELLVWTVGVGIWLTLFVVWGRRR